MTVYSFKSADQKSGYAELDALGSKLGRKIFGYAKKHRLTGDHLDFFVEIEVLKFRVHLVISGLSGKDNETACACLHNRILEELVSLPNSLPDDGGTLQ